jgi:hypothetical protein
MEKDPSGIQSIEYPLQNLPMDLISNCTSRTGRRNTGDLPRECNFGKIGTHLGSSISHKIECQFIQILIFRADSVWTPNSLEQQILEDAHIIANVRIQDFPRRALSFQ